MIDIWVDANRNFVEEPNDLIGKFKTVSSVDGARLGSSNCQVLSIIVWAG